MLSNRHVAPTLVAAAVTALAGTGTPLAAQSTTNDPFPDPIEATEGVILVGAVDFGSLPNVEGAPARPMNLVDEPGTSRMFTNDMRGPIYTVSYSGEVSPYLDVNAPHWGIPVNASGRERGMQSFTLHPQFSQRGTPGFG